MKVFNALDHAMAWFGRAAMVVLAALAAYAVCLMFYCGLAYFVDPQGLENLLLLVLQFK